MPDIPSVGELPGQLFLNPQIAPQVTQGAPARPLAPGEYLMNPNGSWSSEMTYTLQMPNGQYAVIPGMWIVGGKPMRVNEDTALDYAVKSGLNWQTYADEKTADKASQDREDKWETLNPQTAHTVAPLWSSPQQDRMNMLLQQKQMLQQNMKAMQGG